MNDYQKGWIEALIDSEGCLDWVFNNSRKYRYPRLSIANTCLPFLERAQTLIGGSIYMRKAAKSTWKPLFTLTVRGKALMKFLPELSLIVKEHRRKQILQVWQNTPHRKVLDQ